MLFFLVIWTVSKSMPWGNQAQYGAGFPVHHWWNMFGSGQAVRDENMWLAWFVVASEVYLGNLKETTFNSSDFLVVLFLVLKKICVSRLCSKGASLFFSANNISYCLLTLITVGSHLAHWNNKSFTFIISFSPHNIFMTKEEKKLWLRDFWCLT